MKMKPPRSRMNQMRRSSPKGYAYGSMVRKPMYGGGMAMPMNPTTRREDKMGMTGTMATGMQKLREGTKGKLKEFAALAPPFDKATYADKIAGATKND